MKQYRFNFFLYTVINLHNCNREQQLRQSGLIVDIESTDSMIMSIVVSMLFADLLSLHLVTFLMFFILVHVTFFSSSIESTNSMIMSIVVYLCNKMNIVMHFIQIIHKHEDCKKLKLYTMHFIVHKISHCIFEV